MFKRAMTDKANKTGEATNVAAADSTEPTYVVESLEDALAVLEMLEKEGATTRAELQKLFDARPDLEAKAADLKKQSDIVQRRLALAG